MEKLALITADGTRQAWGFFPPQESAGPRPLILMLHGTGGTATYAATETNWHSFAPARNAVVVYPEGLPLDPELPPKFLTNPQRWNDGSTQPGDRFHTTTDDVGFLAELIRHLIATANVDSQQVLLCGFSNGAGMVYRFAAERSELLTAIAPVSGYCGITPSASSVAVPTLGIFGDADLLIPLAGGRVRLPWNALEVDRVPVVRNLGKWATALGGVTNPKLVSDENGIAESQFPGPVPFRQVIVRGLGHHWPGGNSLFNPKLAGPLSDRLNGCECVWRFFQDAIQFKRNS